LQVVLFEIPLLGLEIRGFGVMAMLSFIIGISLAIWRSRDEALPTPFILDLGIVCLVSGILGARIFFVLENTDTFNWSLFHVWDGGFSIAGAILGFVLPFMSYFAWQAMDESEPVSDRDAEDEADPSSSDSASAMPLLWLVVAGLLVSVLVSRFVYVYLHIAAYTAPGQLDPFAFLKIWQGGIVFYGGLFGGIAGGVSFIYWHGFSVLNTADVFAAPLLLAQAVARWGCLLAGDDFGRRVSESFPLAIRFPREAMITQYQIRSGIIDQGTEFSTWVHPAQLYMSGGVFICFLLLLALEWIGRTLSRSGRIIAGWSFGMMLALYSIHRFIVEFFRGDPVAVYSFFPIPELMKFGGLPQIQAGVGDPMYALRISQLISVFLFVGALLFMVWCWYYQRSGVQHPDKE
jgi:prolipoprotein diacylglyceryltransferase